MASGTEDDTVVDFDQAKRIHVFERSEKKVLDIRKAFKAARLDGLGSKPSVNRKSRKKQNKKKKK